MTKSELAPYLNAVTNEERTFLICQTSEGAYKLFKRLPYFVFNIIVHPNTE